MTPAIQNPNVAIAIAAPIGPSNLFATVPKAFLIIGPVQVEVLEPPNAH